MSYDTLQSHVKNGFLTRMVEFWWIVAKWSDTLGFVQTIPVAGGLNARLSTF